MKLSAAQILARHRATLAGALRLEHVPSDALGLSKPVFLYEPPGLERLARVPLLYLFRGHECEWVDPAQDETRGDRTAVERLDRMIAEGTLPPVLVAMPGLSSADHQVLSLGIDMVGPWPEEAEGLGTGRFWSFLVQDLLPALDRRYPQAAEGLRLAAGFSIGGYTASLLALRRPGYLHHAAMYDGLFMWAGHRDPRGGDGAGTDLVWTGSPVLAPALGSPRDPAALRRWNTTDLLLEAGGDRLDRLRRTTFWVATADADGDRGNRDRGGYFAALLREKRLRLGFEDVVFAPGAAHTWGWADRFLEQFLTRALGDRG